MNQLMLLVLVLVAFCYFGGKYCPSVLKQNKEMLLGVVIGMAICSFMGVEGYGSWQAWAAEPGSRDTDPACPNPPC
jgi:hypothetical protein